MKLSKRKLLALSLSAVLAVSTFSVQAAEEKSGKSEPYVDENGRVAYDQEAFEIPGTVSTFDEYNTSFLSVSGFAKGKVNDRTADYGTSKYRQVTTQEQLFKAIRDARLNTGTASEVSQGAVSVIEIMNDLKITYNAAYQDVIQVSPLNKGYENVQGSLVSEVVDIKLDDIKGLTIFSANGSKILGGTLQIGVGGTNGKGCEDIVVRNLAFDGAWQWDNQGKHKENGWTYVKVYHSSGIWLDHCSFTVAGDGNVDLESGSNGVTLSWCKIGLTPEEAKKDDCIVNSSVKQMEKKYQSAYNAATKRGGIKDLVGLRDSYHEVVNKIEKAGYDVSDTVKMAELEKKKPDLYSEYQEVKAYFSFFGVNKGTLYADMRIGGATSEEIMEYAAYHSKVHLTGSGDKEFMDYDILKTSTATQEAAGIADSTKVAVEEVVAGDTTTTTETFVKDEVATVTTTSLRIITDSNDRLQLSLGYNWYRNIAQRVPMIRMGVGHLYNCYIDDMEHYNILASNEAIAAFPAYRMSRCINARDGASIGADTCVFYGINQPIIGTEKQGDDIGNLNELWDSLYADAINHAVIVNSKITNSKGQEYTGSSWDNDGDNLFTSDGGLKYTELTLKKWTWNSSIVSLGKTPLSEVSRNDMCNGTKWKKLPYVVPILEEDGSPKLNSNKNPMYEPFVWDYDYESTLGYDYQLLKLDDVQPVVTSQAGAGAVSFPKAENWLRTEYVKNDSLMEDSGLVPEPVTPEPITPEPVTPEPITPEPVTPEPVTPEPVTPEPITPEPVTPGTVTPGPVEPPMEDVLLGDIDRDGFVKLNDAQRALRLALLLDETNSVTNRIGDTDGDGKINLSDAQKILRVALLLDTFENPTIKVPKV